MGSATRVLMVVALVGAGFTGGWWLRGQQTPDTTMDSVAPRDLRPAPAAEPPAEPRTAPVVGATPPPVQPQQQEAESTNPPEPEQSASADEADYAQQLQALLEERAFDAAMNLYTEVDRRDLTPISELKQIVVAYIQRYLRDQDDSAATGLIDAFLSRYYNDIDVLLLLARYHLESDYPTEAARTFQLAFAYALNDGDRQLVQRAFQNAVREVDDQLSGQQRWQELIGFYETLALLDLTQPLYQLRQAELYLAQGEPYLAQELLSQLTEHPSVAAQARALLAGVDPDSVPATAPQHGAVALGTHGDHFHLPLEINGMGEVRLVIDTGASTTTLSRSAFDQVSRFGGFTELGPQVFNTANGVAKGTIYRADAVQLGDYRLSDVHIAVLDFDMPNGLDGLLGMNILRQFRFQVDQDAEQLILQPRP